MKFKINPVYRKELKISTRIIRMSLIILGYNLLLALIGLLAFSGVFEVGYYSRIEYSGILWIYIALTVIEFCLVLFVVPAFTAGAIAGEREKQTLEILLTTKLRPHEIIRGKLMSSISSTLLLVISSLPILALTFSVGGIRLMDLLEFMVFCVVTAVFVGSIGLFFSTMFKKTVPATVVTYGTILLVIAGTFALVVVTYFIIQQGYQNWFYEAGGIGEYAPPGVGNLILILLINPAISLLSLLSSQFGSDYYLQNILMQYGNTGKFVFDHWYGISMLIQLGMSALLLWISGKKLNPLGKS